MQDETGTSTGWVAFKITWRYLLKTEMPKKSIRVPKQRNVKNESNFID